MPPTVPIRHGLRPGDLTYVLASHQRHYSVAYGYTAAFEYRIAVALAETYAAGGATRWWFAEAAGQRVGSVAMMDRGEGRGQLRFFFVEEAYRGRGLGQRLLGGLLAHLKAAALPTCYLWTTTEQTAALALYARFGFRETERGESWDFGVGQVNLRLEWGGGLGKR